MDAQFVGIELLCIYDDDVDDIFASDRSRDDHTTVTFTNVQPSRIQRGNAASMQPRYSNGAQSCQQQDFSISESTIQAIEIRRRLADWTTTKLNCDLYIILIMV